MEEIIRLKVQLSRMFDMKDLGAEKYILGMDIHRDRKNGNLSLAQQKYVERVLENFGIDNVKLVNVPLPSHFNLSLVLSPRTDEEKKYMSRVPYENAVGNLMYAMVSTRPDISHAVGVVCMFMENPREEHWRVVKWVLRYLRGTNDHCIIFNGSEGSVYGYVDVDYAGDLDKRRFTTGYVFTLAGRGISWMSKLQEIFAFSIIEEEYITALDASKEAI